MPRYHLHVRQGAMHCRDIDGEIFPNFEEAHAEAVRSARELAAEAVANNEPVRGHLEIEDVHGRILATVWLRDTIVIEG